MRGGRGAARRGGSAPGSGGGQAPARAARPQVITAPPTCISSPGGKMRGEKTAIFVQTLPSSLRAGRALWRDLRSLSEGLI